MDARIVEHEQKIVTVLEITRPWVEKHIKRREEKKEIWLRSLGTETAIQELQSGTV